MVSGRSGHGEGDDRAPGAGTGDLDEPGILKARQGAVVEVVRRRLSRVGVDGVALDDPCAVGAGLLDGGVEQAPDEPVTAELLADDETGDRSDGFVVERFW